MFISLATTRFSSLSVIYQQPFYARVKGELKRRGIARNFYDDTNLLALVNLCSRRLQKRFDARDVHFLCLYLQYCLLQHHAGISPLFNPLQRHWLESCIEFQVAQEMGRHWQRRARQPVPTDEPLFMALLFPCCGFPIHCETPISMANSCACQLTVWYSIFGS